MDKNGFMISNYVVAIIIFSIVIISGIGIIYQFASVDNTFMPNDEISNFNSTFNKYNEINNSVGDLKTSITDSKAEPSIFGVLDGLVTTGWSAIRSTYSSFNFMTSSFNQLSYYLGINQQIIYLLASIITVLIAYAIFKLIFQTEV